MFDKSLAKHPMRRTGWTLPFELLSGLGALSDIIALILAAVLAHFLHFPADTLPQYRIILLFGLLAGGLVAALYSGRHYRFEKLIAPLRGIRRQLVPLAIVFTAFWLLGGELLMGRVRAEGWLTDFILLALPALLITRLALFLCLYAMARSGRLRRRIAIFGTGPQAEKLISQLRRERPNINQLVGIFDDRVGRLEHLCSGYAIEGDVSSLYRAAREKEIDEIVIALPWSADQRVLAVANALRDLPVRLRIASDMISFRFPGRHISDDLCSGLPMVDVARKPLSGWNLIAKGLEDKILALIALCLLAPLMLLVAAAVKLSSPGPVFFRQPRYGFNNQEFSLLKFRSMYQPRNRRDRKEAGTRQATKGDKRITPVGRFIRRTSLDELPQLFNVLAGQMSMVGPRPHTVQHNERYASEIDGYLARHKVKPGITGWAQVNGLRGETDTLEKMEYRVRYDLYYIENWSLLFDMEILLLTVFVWLSARNAY